MQVGDVLQVKILPGGPWHRRAIGMENEMTACGAKMGGMWAFRDHTYEGQLCEEGCFSTFERSRPKTKREENP